MIILSVGMPRAGSGWHYNLIRDLMATTGCADARDIRRRYRLQGILTAVNCNIGVLSLRRLAMVMLPSQLGNTFVIKAHASPTIWARALINLGLVRATYIYRDPRDAMLSAYEYGQRGLKRGKPNAFSFLKDFETALDFMMEYVRGWAKWIQCKRVLHVRYEGLLTDYDGESARLLAFLGLDGKNEAVCAVIEQYRPGKLQEGQQGLHFYKGQTGRFRQKFTPEQQETLAQKFGPYLQWMGYDL